MIAPRGRHPAGRKPAPPPQAEIDISIDRIGTAGDGIAQRGDGTQLHVPRSLPGERLGVQPDPGGARNVLARIVTIHRPSPERVTPPCPLFQDCGGCALQHWEDAAYAAWKRGLVISALQRAGFADPNVLPLIRTPAYARRRMDLAAQRRDGGVTLGLHRAHAKDIVDLTTCVVLHPTLLALIAPLRKTLSSLAALRNAGSVIVNLFDSGADLLIRTDGPVTPADRTKIAAFASAHRISRIAVALNEGPTEAAFLQTAPYMIFAGTRVEPPPGAFLQASVEGEAAIVSAVIAGLPQKLTNKSRAIELYAGIGTISFAVAARLRLVAFEGDAEAAASVRRAQSNARVEMTQRDLIRQPLSAKELSGAAAIILDPPFAGSPPQMPPIAASGVRRVIYVSCSPGALGRDATVLRGAGYGLLSATPIDQFLWSAQVECVAVFEKSKRLGGMKPFPPDPPAIY